MGGWVGLLSTHWVGSRDVLERPYTVGGRGGTPPPPQTPLLPLQCLRLTAKILLWRLRGRTVRCAKSWLFSTTGSSVSSED